MDSFIDLINATYSDLTASSESDLYNLTAVMLAVNRANQKAGSLFKWPKTQSAQTTDTQKNIDYYDVPDNWKPDSAWKLTVDDLDYGKPLLFEDYLKFKEDNPASVVKKWSQQWTRYFISPTPTADGVKNISIFGFESVAWLVNDTDTTIFSYNMRDCNDAIVQEAVAILKAKAEDENSSIFRSTTAKSILTTAWVKIQQGQMHKRKIQPMFQVPDFFGGNVNRVIIEE